MELTVYRHADSHPFHIDIALNSDDFTTSIEQTHRIEERVSAIQSSGSCLLEVFAKVALKADVLEELVSKVGSAEDVADLLGVDRFCSNEFSNLIADGNYDRAARYTGRSAILEARVKARRDSKAVTIRIKVGEAMTELSHKAHEKILTLISEKTMFVANQAERKRQDYHSYVLRQISNNGDQFEVEHATEIASLRERIAGYEAMLKEARQQIRNLKNKEVLTFALKDGKMGDAPIEPIVLAEVQEKARSNEFFSENMFGIGL